MRPRALFVGRFQPFHRGHLRMAEAILKAYPEVIIALGSAQYSHTPENPFTAAERYEMIDRTLSRAGHGNYRIIPVPDVGVHALWVPHLQTLVPPYDVAFTNDPLSRRLFQEAGVRVEERPLMERKTLSGTEVRRRILSGEAWEELLPPPVVEVMREIDGANRIRSINGSRGQGDEHKEKP